jgi:Signal transduction histidine kinase
MKQIYLALALFVYISCSLYAAVPIQKLRLEHGLSNNYVVAITQDRQGVMWIATRSGLNRFDGREFRVFKKGVENSINSDELNTVFADTVDDKIWIATSRRGLSVFDCRSYKFTSYVNEPRDPTSLTSNNPTDIKGDSKGNLWIATYNGGVDYFDKQSQKFIHYNTSNVKGLPSNMVWSISDDHKGNIYIAHEADGVSVVSIKKRIARNFRHNPKDPMSLPDNTVPCVFIDSRKNLWVGTANGLALFNPQTEKFIVFRNIPGNTNTISNSFISNLQETSDGKLLIGTVLGGLNILDLKQITLSTHPDKVHFIRIEAGHRDDELSNSYVMTLFNDVFGNIWIGTYGGGINFISGKTPFFHIYLSSPLADKSKCLSSQIVRGFCFDHQNSLWVATDGGGVDVFKGEEKIANFSQTNGRLLENNVFAAFTDSEGSQWFGTFEGLIIRRDPYSGVFKYISGFGIKKGVHINCFYEDHNKNVWIGTNNGLQRYNLVTRRIQSYYTTNSGIPDNMVMAVTQDSQGYIWVGTFGGEIAILDNALHRVRLICPNNKLSAINQFYCDSKKHIWVATGDKLFMFRSWTDRYYKTYGTAQGLSSNNIAAVMEGNDSRIWCSTNSGISSINLYDQTVKNYNRYDGIPLGNFMMGAVAKSTSGIIYFGSDNGVCYFDSKAQINEPHVPSGVITDFSVNDVKDSHKGEMQHFSTLVPINLKYNQNTFSISFNVPDYSYNNKIEFSYMLEGLDEDWYYIKNTREVTFRNLAPGNYTFKVRSRYKSEEWSNRVSSLNIIINPPFWLTWWAKSLYGLVVLIIAGLIFHFFKEKQNYNQQQKLNAERLKFYTNITHELRTPLTLIIGPLEDMINDIKIQEKYLSKIQTIYKSANRLLDLINQILEFRKTESHNRKLCVQRNDLSLLIRETALKYTTLNNNSNLTINCQIMDGNYTIFYDTEVIVIILDNLLSNAIKYTPSGEISISLRQIVERKIGYTEIEVSDTGYGIDKDSLPFIFNRYYQVQSKHQASGTGIGLAIVKSLAELHDAEIYVDSKPGYGTQFRIRLITENLYSHAMHQGEEKSNAEENIANQRSIILVVEDDADIRKYITETFEGEFEVLDAKNGSDGLNIAFSRIPDIIISDLMMPIMDGMKFCEKIKEDQRTSHIPFIMLTAKDTIQDKTEGYTAGADSYITKPFSGSLLHSRVINLLDVRRKIAAQFATIVQVNDEITLGLENPLDQEFITKITNYIEEHLSDENIDIADIANSVNMSYSSLYRKIKALTELSINEFIRKVRFRNAKKSLSTGMYNVSEVMVMVGINSPAYFRKCFKEEFGVSPSDYIRQIKKKDLERKSKNWD